MTRSTPFINSQTVTDGAGDLVQRFEYNIDSTAKYVGYAPRGTGSSEERWQIKRFTYVSQQVTLIESAYGSWDNRTGLDYA